MLCAKWSVNSPWIFTGEGHRAKKTELLKARVGHPRDLFCHFAGIFFFNWIDVEIIVKQKSLLLPWHSCGPKQLLCQYVIYKLFWLYPDNLVIPVPFSFLQKSFFSNLRLFTLIWIDFVSSWNLLQRVTNLCHLRRSNLFSDLSCNLQH